MASNSEKVKCFECGESLLKKNLKTHYTRHHPDKTAKYRSILHKNVLDLFNENATTILKRKADDETAGDETLQPPSPKKKCIEANGSDDLVEISSTNSTNKAEEVVSDGIGNNDSSENSNNHITKMFEALTSKFFCIIIIF